MASENLIKQVENAEKLIARDGAKLEYADALRQYGQYILQEEKDHEYALHTFAIAKKCYEDYVSSNADYDIWRLEQYCLDNEVEHPIIENYYEILKMESWDNFESFMYYMERKRKPNARFYQNREETLSIVAQDLMDLENRVIKFLGVSLPARTGKSTICIFFLAWVAMKRPNDHNAMGGHSGLLAKGFYGELLELITSEEYCFSEIFCYWHPRCRQVLRKKSAEEYTITLDRPDRFATITCRGIDGTWTGAVDISKDGYLYVDDLIRDREHSLNAQRMENTYQEYLNKMVDRKNDGARELMVGTLWNISDPLERMRVKYEGNPEYRFRKIPALDENDESNFQYKVNGFSSEYYREVRDRLDDAEWMAKYQQAPYVREGLLLPADELHRFDGNLPYDKDISTMAICDPALGGGDSLSMPIVKFNKKDTNYYVIDWVFTNESIKTSVPKVVSKIKQHNIPELVIENDGVGTVVIKEIKDEMARQGVLCKITPKHAPKSLSKEDKIKGTADHIKDHFYFLKDGENEDAEYIMSGEYRNALGEACMYTSEGKNMHDDAIDSLAQMSIYFKPINENGSIEIPTWWRGLHI